MASALIEEAGKVVEKHIGAELESARIMLANGLGAAKTFPSNAVMRLLVQHRESIDTFVKESLQHE